jgi:hypothetical protein
MSIKCHFKDQPKSGAINNFPRMSSKMSENDCNALFALMYEKKLPTKFIPWELVLSPLFKLF